MLKTFFRRRAKLVTKPAAPAKIAAQPSKLDAEHWLSERRYWSGKLRDWMWNQYQLPLHPLQADDATVPEPKLVSHIQNPQKCNPDNYFATGNRAVLNFLRELHDHGANPMTFERMLEFGVGLGRLMRHFVSFPCQRFGCDVTADVLDFSRRTLGRHVELAQNSLAPPLPYADGMFDFVYANSVFTHIQMTATEAWIAELQRVVRPRGYVIATVFEANYYLNHLTPRQLDEIEHGAGYYEWGSAEVRERYMYLSRNKLFEIWGRYFEVLELRQHFREQSHLILRKRPPA